MACGRYSRGVITRGPLLVLIGPPGVGKSTVGAMVARRLGVDFHDFDDDMQQAHGIGAGELVVDLGRERFQLAERDLLARMLPSRSGVLALGGGTPTSPGVAAMLADLHVVFLDADLEHLLARDGITSQHPWLMPEPRARLEQLLTDRRPIYVSLAKAVVSTSGRRLDDIVGDVLTTMPAPMTRSADVSP